MTETLKGGEQHEETARCLCGCGCLGEPRVTSFDQKYGSQRLPIARRSSQPGMLPSAPRLRRVVDGIQASQRLSK